MMGLQALNDKKVNFFTKYESWLVQSAHGRFLGKDLRRGNDFTDGIDCE
jgi:hypothetical protein